MEIATFDTLAYARDLEAAGVDRRQAEAHAEALHKAVASRLGQLVTRTDLDAGLAGTKADLDAGLAGTKADLDAGLARVKADLDAGLARMKADLDAGLLGLENRLLQTAVGIVLANVALTVSLVKLL